MKAIISGAVLALIAGGLQAQVWSNTGHIGRSLLSTDLSAAQRISASTYDETYQFVLAIECDPVDHQRNGTAFSPENTRFLLWARPEDIRDTSTLYASFDGQAPLQVSSFNRQTPVYTFKVDSVFWSGVLTHKHVMLSSESRQFMVTFPLEGVSSAINNIRCLGEKS